MINAIFSTVKSILSAIIILANAFANIIKSLAGLNKSIEDGVEYLNAMTANALKNQSENIKISNDQLKVERLKSKLELIQKYDELTKDLNVEDLKRKAEEIKDLENI